jgi:DNA-binding NarL/FixJ family response regulator
MFRRCGASRTLRVDEVFFAYRLDVSTELRALLVDDDPFTRMVLSSLLRELHIDVVAAVGSATEAMETLSANDCEIAVLDLDLGEGPTGIDLAHGLRRIRPTIGIIVLSTYAEPRLIGSKQQAMPVGARYLVKQTMSESEALGDVIADVIRSPLTIQTRSESSGALSELSDSQVDIMRLIAEGRSNEDIARLVFLAEGSVEKAIARIIKKLGVKADRTQNQRVMLAQFYFQVTKAGRGPRE